MFYVPNGNAKNTEMHAFHTYALVIKHVQDDKNTRAFSCMSSDLFSANEHVA